MALEWPGGGACHRQPVPQGNLRSKEPLLLPDDRTLQGKWPMRILRVTDRRSLSRSATRALDVLEYFGMVRRPLRAIEIARRFELHPSTVNQLLKTMVDSAHLTFDAASKTYLPSPRLTRFGRWLIDTYGSDERLRELVLQLHARSDEIVTLTTPNDRFMQVIDVAGVDFATDEHDGAERGLRVSMFGSAIGAAYLATLPAMEVRRLAERARIPDAQHDVLLGTLVQIRQDGFAEGPSGEGSFLSIAAALPENSLGVPLVLGVAGPVERMRGKLPYLSTLLRSSVDSLSATKSADSIEF
jgi:DNA-binding IclR family transcriptional regulator